MRLLKPLRGTVQIFTPNNGLKFVDRETVANAVTAAIYFCDPHCFSQRGTNENTNGPDRAELPHGNGGHRCRVAQGRQEAEWSPPRKRLILPSSGGHLVKELL